MIIIYIVSSCEILTGNGQLAQADVPSAPILKTLFSRYVVVLVVSAYESVNANPRDRCSRVARAGATLPRRADCRHIQTCEARGGARAGAASAEWPAPGASLVTGADDAKLVAMCCVNRSMLGMPPAFGSVAAAIAELVFGLAPGGVNVMSVPPAPSDVK
jgi:hypothetical protein